MGIVASLASVPVTLEIARVEAVREQDRKDDLKYGRYHVGDTDLTLIKKLTDAESRDLASAASYRDRTANGHDASQQLNSKVEQIYLTGGNREKYKYISKRLDREEQLKTPMKTPLKTPSRKVRSAYPNVRFQ